MIRLCNHPTLTYFFFVGGVGSVDGNMMMMVMMITALFRFLCLWRHQSASICGFLIFLKYVLGASFVLSVKGTLLRAYFREVDMDQPGD